MTEVNVGTDYSGLLLNMLGDAKRIDLDYDVEAKVELNEALTTKLVQSDVDESTARSKALNTVANGMEQQMLASAAGQWTQIGLQVGQLIGGLVGLHFQGKMANLEARLKTRMMALTEDVAQHRMQLEDKTLDAQVAATDKKMELAKVLAKTKADLQKELAKIQAGAVVQIEQGKRTAALFLKQPNYGSPTIKAV